MRRRDHRAHQGHAIRHEHRGIFEHCCRVARHRKGSTLRSRPIRILFISRCWSCSIICGRTNSRASLFPGTVRRFHSRLCRRNLSHSSRASGGVYDRCRIQARKVGPPADENAGGRSLERRRRQAGGHRDALSGGGRSLPSAIQMATQKCCSGRQRERVCALSGSCTTPMQSENGPTIGMQRSGVWTRRWIWRAQTIGSIVDMATDWNIVFPFPPITPENRMSTIATVIGLAAAVCTTAANLPQLKKAWTTGQTDDLSLKTLLLVGVGFDRFGSSTASCKKTSSSYWRTASV